LCRASRAPKGPAGSGLPNENGNLNWQQTESEQEQKQGDPDADPPRVGAWKN